jgi:hypothetical protein
MRQPEHGSFQVEGKDQVVGGESASDASNVVTRDIEPRAEPQPSTVLAELRNLLPSGTVPLPKPDWQRTDDPRQDGWMTEHYADEAKHLLSDLIEAVLSEDGDAATTWGLAHGDPDPVVQTLTPPLAEVFTWRGVHVTRWAANGESALSQNGGFDAAESSEPINGAGSAELQSRQNVAARTGAANLYQAITQWQQTWAEYTNRRHEVKVFRILPTTEGFVTHQYIAVSGRNAESLLEQHATWVADWRVDSASGHLRLQALRPTALEQVRSELAKPWFNEITPSVLGANTCYPEQLLYGLNHWIDRTQDMRYFSPLGNPGLAVGDVNGDGRDDVYLCQEANLPNRLFLQQPDGTAIEVSADWGVDWLEGSRSALLTDLDNDGDQDLCVAILGGIVVASNEGDHFRVREVVSTHDDTTTITAADYDQDGDLDLYVCVDYPNDFFASSREAPVQGGAANRVYHDANNGGRNSLFRNDGQFRFTDVTSESGLDVNNRRYSWAACWEDVDDDGDPDLYVSNDFGRNNLYINHQGSFTDRAAEAGAEDIASGMSAAWGDVNRDGRMDLYVGNMFSSAGGRVTFQDEFKANADESIRSRLRQFARGNSLLMNSGDGTFQDVSEDAGVTVARWAWSSNFIDVNNDGWQDLAVANGYITADDTGDL